MNTDIRLSVEFFDHPKTVKLRRRLGPEALLCLQRLWIWSAQNREDGRLYGMDAEDIGIAAHWEGEPENFVRTLAELRFLDRPETEDVYSLHQWTEHQEYACKAGERREKARRAALARHAGGAARKAERGASQDAPSLTRLPPSFGREDADAEAPAFSETWDASASQADRFSETWAASVPETGALPTTWNAPDATRNVPPRERALSASSASAASAAAALSASSPPFPASPASVLYPCGDVAVGEGSVSAALQGATATERRGDGQSRGGNEQTDEQAGEQSNDIGMFCSEHAPGMLRTSASDAPYRTTPGLNTEGTLTTFECLSSSGAEDPGPTSPPASTPWPQSSQSILSARSPRSTRPLPSSPSAQSTPLSRQVPPAQSSRSPLLTPSSQSALSVLSAQSPKSLQPVPSSPSARPIPSASPASAAPLKRPSRSTPPCPYEAVRDLYHRTFPEHPRVAVLSAKRKSAVKARWAEVGARLRDLNRPDATPDRLEYLRRLFAKAARSDLLTGRRVFRDGGVYRVDFDKLMSPGGFVGVIEGKYDNREAA